MSREDLAAGQCCTNRAEESGQATARVWVARLS